MRQWGLFEAPSPESCCPDRSQQKSCSCRAALKNKTNRASTPAADQQRGKAQAQQGRAGGFGNDGNREVVHATCSARADSGPANRSSRSIHQAKINGCRVVQRGNGTEIKSGVICTLLAICRAPSQIGRTIIQDDIICKAGKNGTISAVCKTEVFWPRSAPRLIEGNRNARIANRTERKLIIIVHRPSVPAQRIIRTIASGRCPVSC